MKKSKKESDKISTQSTPKSGDNGRMAAYPNLRPRQAGVPANPAKSQDYLKLLEEKVKPKDRVRALRALARQTRRPDIALAAIKYIDDRTIGPLEHSVSVKQTQLSIDYNMLGDQFDMLNRRLRTVDISHTPMPVDGSQGCPPTDG